MGCGDACPMVNARNREDWNIPDPRDMDEAEFRKVRDLIESKVKELLQKIS
jgi:protein-tyrosine-phosphatase